MNNVISHLLRMGFPMSDIEEVVVTCGTTEALKRFGMRVA